MATQIQLRRDTAANWTSTNPTMAQGEAGYETDTGKLKVGDGTTAWNSLAYQAAANIVDGTIVNADINASAAIAGTKISPDFGSQALSTTGLISANGKVSFPLGTAALPSLYPGTDTNTGIYSPGADQVAISTNGAGRLFVDSNGRVISNKSTAQANAIGDRIPWFQIHTTVGNAVWSSYANFNWVNSTSGAGLVLAKSRSSVVGTNATINSGDEIGSISFLGDNGTDFRFAASIDAISTETPSATSMPGALLFRTTASGANVAAERMRLDSSGRLGLGTSSPTALLDARSLALNTNSLTPTVLANSVQLRIVGLNNDNTTGTYVAGISLGELANACSAILAVDDGASQATGLGFVTGNGSAVAERLRIDSSGRVGIGTTSPNESLEVAGNIHVSGADRSIFNRSNNALTFGTNNAERARIDSSGRLLVGTSTARANYGGGSESSALQLEGTGANRRLSVTGADNAAVAILARQRSGSVGGNTIVQVNNILGALRFEGSDGTNFIIGADISATVDGTPGTNNMPCRLIFSTTADGASSPTERLRITSAGVLQIADAGNISVGTTTGTKIGTATTQKLGFYNATPVVQPTAVADATDAASVITQLNALLTRMRNLGLIAT